MSVCIILVMVSNCYISCLLRIQLLWQACHVKCCTMLIFLFWPFVTSLDSVSSFQYLWITAVTIPTNSRRFSRFISIFVHYSVTAATIPTNRYYRSTELLKVLFFIGIVIGEVVLFSQRMLASLLWRLCVGLTFLTGFVWPSFQVAAFYLLIDLDIVGFSGFAIVRCWVIRSWSILRPFTNIMGHCWLNLQ